MEYRSSITNYDLRVIVDYACRFASSLWVLTVNKQDVKMYPTTLSCEFTPALTMNNISDITDFKSN